MRSKFSWKAFISISLGFSFLIIFITGIVLYFAPAGRVAHWVNWKLFGLSKEDWQAIHTVFSYLFAIASIFHLFSMNWKVFWSYLKNKTSGGINKKRELYLASLFTVIVIVGVLINIPPFSSVMQFGSYLTDSWENVETEAPVPHAERLTIPQLVEKLDGITTDQVMARLKNNQIKVNSLNETLEEIGGNNNMSPIEIYKIITYKPAKDMASTGIGRKPLTQVATMLNKDIGSILLILEQNNIKATQEQNIKEIAQKNDMPAKNIFELISK